MKGWAGFFEGAGIGAVVVVVFAVIMMACAAVHDWRKTHAWRARISTPVVADECSRCHGSGKLYCGQDMDYTSCLACGGSGFEMKVL